MLIQGKTQSLPMIKFRALPDPAISINQVSPRLKAVLRNTFLMYFQVEISLVSLILTIWIFWTLQLIPGVKDLAWLNVGQLMTVLLQNIMENEV